MNVDVKIIKKIREETGAGILDIKKALEKFDGDEKKAKEHLEEIGRKIAEKKSDRETKDGLIYAYVHNGKVGSMINMACETDFVAKTDEFQKLCKEVALQVTSMDYENKDELLEAEYIRDPSKKIKDLITETIAQLGENIELVEFVKLSV